jgi:hypothetical protein
MDEGSAYFLRMIHVAFVAISFVSIRVHSWSNGIGLPWVLKPLRLCPFDRLRAP